MARIDTRTSDAYLELLLMAALKDKFPRADNFKISRLEINDWSGGSIGDVVVYVDNGARFVYTYEDICRMLLGGNDGK